MCPALKSCFARSWRLTASAPRRRSTSRPAWWCSRPEKRVRISRSPGMADEARLARTALGSGRPGGDLDEISLVTKGRLHMSKVRLRPGDRLHAHDIPDSAAVTRGKNDRGPDHGLHHGPEPSTLTGVARINHRDLGSWVWFSSWHAGLAVAARSGMGKIPGMPASRRPTRPVDVPAERR